MWEVSGKVDSIAIDVAEVSRDIKIATTNDFLERLPRAKYASYDCERSDRPVSCFEGTRTAILEDIDTWIFDTNPNSPRVFWLNGLAGIGKTTIARTATERLQKRNQLGGNFFFSRRGEAELRNPALVFPSIAYQLARFNPEFGRRITTALETDPEAPYASLKQQLERLIVTPLSEIERDPENVVVLVFDAFDECEARGAKEILQLLIAAIPSLPFFLKIFITARPEHHIRSVLLPASGLQITALHDIEKSIVKKDILLYLQAKLRELPGERGMDLPPDWITEDEILLLADQAGNLFIHAATSLRFLMEGWGPREQLDMLLMIISSPHRDGANPFANLDTLYQQILLAHIPESNSSETAAPLRLVLGTIVLLRDPLPVAALERLVGLGPGKAGNILQYLHSVILTPPPPGGCPKVYHPSFPDFLQDALRCTDRRLWINTEEHEVRMLLACLAIIKAKLHPNMLGNVDGGLLNSEMVDLETKLEIAFPPELRHACRYWASHLARTTPGDPAVQVALDDFASTLMLPWMEAMSWLGATREAVVAFEDTRSWMVCPCLRYVGLTDAELFSSP